jgi:hypothetical protein
VGVIRENFGHAILPLGFHPGGFAPDLEPILRRGRASLNKLPAQFNQAQSAAVEFHGPGCASMNHPAITPDGRETDLSVG